MILCEPIWDYRKRPLNNYDCSLMAMDKRSREIKEYIGSPEGMGRGWRKAPLPGIINRKVLDCDGQLVEKHIEFGSYLGSGLGSTVYKSTCNGRAIVEKFTADIPSVGSRKSAGKILMEAVFVFFRQTLPSYRTNFYAAMSNHYASLIIADAIEFELGERFAPRLEYTTYDENSGGYVLAYEYMEGRPIRPGLEERLLRENLKRWKAVIADRLGLWGLARQCDVNNINSPGNVLVTDENTLKMKLIDVTPGVLGGQVYLLPLEFEYLLKGIATGNFLPFGDAIDIRKFHRYRDEISRRYGDLSSRFGAQPLTSFINNCHSFEYYLNKWRDSEPCFLRSPLRIFQYFFNINTVKATTVTMATNLEYAGAISTKKATKVRKAAEGTNKPFVLTLLRLDLLTRLVFHIVRNISAKIWEAIRYIFLELLWCAIKAIGSFVRFTVKVYIDSHYRRKVSSEMIEKWIMEAEKKDKIIIHSQAETLRAELQNKDILKILEVGPLWVITKAIKPPFIGTAANVTILYMLFSKFNPYLLIPLFADGIVRFLVVLIFTGFKYKRLLLLSLIPTLGFVIPIPMELMSSAPALTEFLMKYVIGSKIGTSLPGVDKHSFRTYFYIRLMGIPLYLMK